MGVESGLMEASQRVLIQCGDHFENQCRILQLTRTLQKLGHEPLVMLYSNGRGDIFRQTGVSVVYLNDYLQRARPADNLKDDTAIVHGISTRDLISVEGRRRPRISWPGQMRKTRLDAQRYLFAVEQILDEHRPDRVAVWNGFTGYAANSLRMLCEKRGIGSAYLERGLAPGSLFIDKEGVNGASSLLSFDADTCLEPTSDELRVLEKYFPASTTSSATSKPQTTSKTANDRNIFFPLQVERDTNILLYSPFMTMRNAFHAAYKSFNQEQTRFVVRLHPEEEPGHRPNIPRYKNVTIDIEQTLTEQIDAADLVITINSTVGLEALIQGKPVCAYGQSIYSAICTDPLQANHIDDFRVSRSILRKYLATLCRENLLIEGKDTNQSAVLKQLQLQDLQIDKTLNRPIRLEQVSALNRRFDTDEEILVDLAANPVAPLDMTYRKNKERPSLAEQKRLLFPNINPSRIRLRPLDQVTVRGDILVVDEGWNGSRHEYLAVANRYGVVMNSADE